MGTDAISPLRQRMIEDIVIARARRFLTLIQVRGRADNPCSRSRHRDELTKEFRTRPSTTRPKAKAPAPVVLSPDEVMRFLEAVPSLRSRTALTTVYAAGLRVGNR